MPSAVQRSSNVREMISPSRYEQLSLPCHVRPPSNDRMRIVQGCETPLRVSLLSVMYIWISPEGSWSIAGSQQRPV